MPEHVGYIRFLREQREKAGLTEQELEHLLTMFPDHFLAMYFRAYRSYGKALLKAGMTQECFDELWRRGPIAALLRGEQPSGEINAIAAILAELRGCTDEEN